MSALELHHSIARETGAAVQELGECLGAELSVFKIADGQLLRKSGEQPHGTPAWRMQLVRDWSNRDEVRLQSLGGSLAVLIVPLANVGRPDAAAMGLFLVADDVANEGRDERARRWPADSNELESWIQTQPPWTGESLRRVANFASKKLASEARAQQLGAEVESLALRIGESFEELSLLYEMTENLRGSSSAAELARLVLDWMIEILPAEQAVIVIHNQDFEPLLQSYGRKHVDSDSFCRLIEHLQPDQQDSPLVLNEETTRDESWPFPDIRELIIVPLRTDNRNTGWLAVVNHASGGWFGTTQARLLHAAATILGTRVLFEEVAALREVSEAASASKSAFLSNVSHEFRTPLNGILSFSRLLLDRLCDEDSLDHDCAVTINECAERLFELVDDVVEFSKLDGGNITVSPIPFRLDEVVTQVVSTLGSRAMSKGLRLEYVNDPGQRVIVHNDPVLVRQVLNILVRNAIKFTETGGIQIISRVSVSGDGWRLSLAVHDTGIGISEEKQNMIFDPFVQADSSLTRSYGGLGLGLTICKRIAFLLGGDLTVESRPGSGSVFTLEIDASIADASLAELEDTHRMTSMADFEASLGGHAELSQSMPLTQLTPALQISGS